MDNKIGTYVYVYSLDSDGKVVERKATITSKREKYIVVRLYGGQMMSLAKTPRTIRKDAMWTDVSQKALYVDKMTELLYQRMEKHRDKIQSAARKLKNMRACI